MKLSELINGTDLKIICGDENAIVENIEIDSRKVSKNTCFVCIEGIHVDGHNFIENAIEQGASVIVVSKENDYKSNDVTFVLAENTRDALAILSINLNNHPSKSFSLIGVTGTNGKTSTTYFIEQMLRNLNKKCGVVGTTGAMILGNPIEFEFETSTTPDAHQLQQVFAKMRDEKCDDVIMEVTSQGLHQKRVFGEVFDVGIFTNLTQDHLDYHNTMNEYYNAKLELFKQSKKCVVNIDDEYGVKISEIVKDVLTVSIDKKSDLQATNIKYNGQGSTFDLIYNEKTYNVEVFVAGKFTIYNILCAIGTLLQLDVNIDDILKVIPKIKGVRGRIESIENDLGVSILVDYAHSPDGLTNIINSVREFTTGRVITVFGCGGDRDKTKRPIMGSIASNLSDICIVTSDNPRTEDKDKIVKDVEEGLDKSKEHYIIVDRKSAIEKAISIAKENDSVIVAGKGHEDYQIIGVEKIHFDDSEECRKAILKISNEK